MEQKLLHKMFNGEATDNELTQIRQWVNADKMNRETFYHESRQGVHWNVQ